MSEQVLQVTREGSIAILTLNRPSSLNAINGALMKSIFDFFQDLSDDLRGIIITGSGEKAFAAGADIKAFELDSKKTAAVSRFGHDTFNAVESAKVPVVAALNGLALGGGLELAMACHFRISEKHARFGLPEIKLGLIPGYGGTFRLPRLIGRSKAARMMLTGEMIDAQRGYEYGLVDEIVNEGSALDRAREILSTVSDNAPISAGNILRLLFDDEISDPMESEIQAFGKAFDTEDAREGISAFVEKRKPTFRGR